jgi:hypothetical protein
MYRPAVLSLTILIILSLFALATSRPDLNVDFQSVQIGKNINLSDSARQIELLYPALNSRSDTHFALKAAISSSLDVISIKSIKYNGAVNAPSFKSCQVSVFEIEKKEPIFSQTTTTFDQYSSFEIIPENQTKFESKTPKMFMYFWCVLNSIPTPNAGSESPEIVFSWETSNGIEKDTIAMPYYFIQKELIKTKLNPDVSYYNTPAPSTRIDSTSHFYPSITVDLGLDRITKLFPIQTVRIKVLDQHAMLTTFDRIDGNSPHFCRMNGYEFTKDDLKIIPWAMDPKMISAIEINIDSMQFMAIFVPSESTPDPQILYRFQFECNSLIIHAPNSHDDESLPLINLGMEFLGYQEGQIVESFTLSTAKKTAKKIGPFPWFRTSLGETSLIAATIGDIIVSAEYDYNHYDQAKQHINTDSQISIQIALQNCEISGFPTFQAYQTLHNLTTEIKFSDYVELDMKSIKQGGILTFSIFEKTYPYHSPRPVSLHLRGVVSCQPDRDSSRSVVATSLFRSTTNGINSDLKDMQYVRPLPPVSSKQSFLNPGVVYDNSAPLSNINFEFTKIDWPLQAKKQEIDKLHFKLEFLHRSNGWLGGFQCNAVSGQVNESVKVLLAQHADDGIWARPIEKFNTKETHQFLTFALDRQTTALDTSDSVVSFSLNCTEAKIRSYWTFGTLTGASDYLTVSTRVEQKEEGKMMITDENLGTPSGVIPYLSKSSYKWTPRSFDEEVKKILTWMIIAIILIVLSPIILIVVCCLCCCGFCAATSSTNNGALRPHGGGGGQQGIVITTYGQPQFQSQQPQGDFGNYNTFGKK